MENENNGNNRFQEKLEHRAQKTPQLKVLVVDDDPSILELLKTALTTIDSYNVTVANSAESAIDALEAATTPFDCLLLDIQMPDTDGIVLLRGIRALPDYSETPIIMLTAMSERSYVDDAFMAGATDYVCKPFDLLDLRGRMNSARRLVKERLKTEKSLRSVKILKQELENNQQFNFEDPLTIDDADRCLRYVEFDNYVGQLSRGVCSTLTPLRSSFRTHRSSTTSPAVAVSAAWCMTRRIAFKAPRPRLTASSPIAARACSLWWCTKKCHRQNSQARKSSTTMSA
ncbi:response regulator [Roseovarius rhodophyticola]|uniref:Response regulator transcription factor n=1 Tax=Roseovarius rhodophyticola TaxID=3080827 RepID=A0ABZ2TI24_9RHOB